jgi:hypothetical protein
LDLGLVQVVLLEPILVLRLPLAVRLVLQVLILVQELLLVLHVLLVLIQQLVLPGVRIVQQAHMLPQQELPRVPLALQELIPPLVQALVLLALQVPTLQLDQARVLHVQWVHILQLVQDLAPLVPQEHMQAPQDPPRAQLVPQVLSLLQEPLHVQVVVLVIMQLPLLLLLVPLVQWALILVLVLLCVPIVLPEPTREWLVPRLVHHVQPAHIQLQGPLLAPIALLVLMREP